MNITQETRNNVVSQNTLRDIQLSTLKTLSDSVSNSLGPKGSNTMILHGNNDAALFVEYSKDGHKILKNIKFSQPIEMSIQTEVEEITRHVEKQIGDGTTTAVMLSYIILKNLLEKDNGLEKPYEVIDNFKKAVEAIKSDILSRKRECTIEDIYNIAYISTNGNEDIANTLYDVYSQYGLNVFIDVDISIDGNNYVKEYNGLTLEVGYSDTAYINTETGVSKISNPRIYYFDNPIDNPHMVNYFEKIIKSNIFDRLSNRQDPIPTVILAPTISKDLSGMIREIIKYLHSFGSNKLTQKPPLLIITNFSGLNKQSVEDIAVLCKCPFIQKYIDPENEKRDQEKGIAPTLDNIVDFHGGAKIVEADYTSTKFVDPDDMYCTTDDGGIVYDNETGNPILSNTYNALVQFIQSELDKSYENADNAAVTGTLKRRLNNIKSNMVELKIGGIAISDRDSLRDLVEDAVLSCRSAATNGVGYACNHMGLTSSANCIANCKDENIKRYLYIIKDSYIELIKLLYDTISSQDNAKLKRQDTLLDEIRGSKYPQALSDPNIIGEIVNNGPLNINTLEYDKKVLTSITSDIIILEAIAKIIVLMYTSNQALVQSPNLNIY